MTRRIAAGAPLALWGLLAALFVLHLDGRAQDDLYITYRYARNLADGDGFVFNSGERVFGLSEPGLGLLLGAVHAATGGDLPRLGSVVYAAALMALAVLLLLDTRARAPAALGGTLILASSYVWTNHGSAATLVLALLAAAALASRRRPALAGLLAGAAAWCRPDALAGAALLGLLVWWEERRFPRRYALAAGAVIAAGLLAAWAWFGTPLPETAAAKRADAFAATGSGVEAARFFWQRAARLAPRHFGAWWGWLLALGAAGLVPLWRESGRAGRLLVLYAGTVALAYTLLGVPFFSWYLVPLTAALLYGLAAVPFAVARRLGAWRPAAGFAAAALLAVLLAWPVVRSAWTWARGFNGYGHLDTYRRAGAWLRANTPPETSVAYVEIGVLGWESERRIVDLMGLVTRAARPYVANRDIAGAFLAAPADVVVFHTRGRMRPLIAQPWFPAAFAEAARFRDRDGPGELTIYRRRPGAPLPPSSRTPR
ncbi:MAG TPA: hypothetical protein VNJ70_09640 [Thermoanaerobaculia bacterium]|nr:hypothetical protein [Thermoanaerobaculia bacterium]